MALHEDRGILPPALKPGDTIALLSPSSRLNDIFPLRVSRATTAIEAIGFAVKKIYTAISPTASHHEQIQHRVAELHSAFSDPQVTAIICTIGGLSSNELLPFVDWELITKNPKIFVGYSDITLLHLAMAKMTGLRTFYGPAAITQFGEFPKPLDFTVQNFLHVLRPRIENVVGEMPRSSQFTDEFGDWGDEGSNPKTRTLESNPGWEWLRKGKCEGRMTGGCLPSLLQLAGTKYWPEMQGKILLLENPEGERPDGPLPMELTRSMMGNLVNLGVFEQIVGLVVGRPTGYVGEELREYEKMMLDMCSGVAMEGERKGEKRGFPILAGVNVGHTDPLLTVPLEALMKLDSGEDSWQVLEPGVML